MDRGSSMQRIADEAGIGRATLHRRYKSREELRQAVTRHALQEIGAVIDRVGLEDGGPVDTVLARLAEALVPMGERYAFLLRELHHDREVQVAVDEFAEELAALMRRGRADGLLRADVPVVWAVDTWLGLVEMAWEGVQHGRLAPRDAPHLVLTTFLSGMRADA
ncbi:TetR/AcrR family transcriptional regulator [Actinomadura sp. 9N215]|uniref:TetR/AcrR family transcriptional regulator n=1 Tax=Actinomadura sp. 9N215 TaxID=3375150 RepID=UPI0037A5DE83